MSRLETHLITVCWRGAFGLLLLSGYIYLLVSIGDLP